jgi:hypothetical protein
MVVFRPSLRSVLLVKLSDGKIYFRGKASLIVFNLKLKPEFDWLIAQLAQLQFACHVGSSSLHISKIQFLIFFFLKNSFDGHIVGKTRQQKMRLEYFVKKRIFSVLYFVPPGLNSIFSFHSESLVNSTKYFQSIYLPFRLLLLLRFEFKFQILFTNTKIFTINQNVN